MLGYGNETSPEILFNAHCMHYNYTKRSRTVLSTVMEEVSIHKYIFFNISQASPSLPPPLIHLHALMQESLFLDVADGGEDSDDEKLKLYSYHFFFSKVHVALDRYKSLCQ